jgi:hypothetical protein
MKGLPMNCNKPAPALLEESQARLEPQRLSRISAVATAVPGHQVGQQVAQQFCRALFHEAYPDIDRLLPVFNNSLVENRYFSVPEEYIKEAGNEVAETALPVFSLDLPFGQNPVRLLLRPASTAHGRLSGAELPPMPQQLQSRRREDDWRGIRY